MRNTAEPDRSERFSAIVVVVLAALAACSPTSQNAALFIPNSSENVRVTNGGNSVSFELSEPYPAERTRLEIDNHYRPPSWRKEDELRLFPGRRTSENPGGWERHLERDQMIYMNVVNWVDSSGNVVTYVTRYRFAENAVPQGGRATVEGIFQAKQ